MRLFRTRPMDAIAIMLALVAIRPSLLGAQGYPPEVAAKKMTPAKGFAVDLVAAEPFVRQPVCIEFDDKGRLWVVQYLQYPNPAGLKRVKVDRYSRTVYDRVPEPPPRGPKGADKITILEDTDGDGRVDRSKDFVTGLNLATGMAFGYGGLFVLQVPYLLFYPDRNHDDVPDGDPEVLLSGFGMEDTSSLANSLTWGPDGWLYGTQGTNITARIRRIDFEQGVWRYHPVTRDFELFCEGGGNSWGLDFDPTGELFYSTNYGGYIMVHGMQGAYYVKQFQKHGELHNPFAFGYFDHVPHAHFQGGHVTVGGLVYQETLFPKQFQGKFIGADLLGHAVNWHTISHDGSTVRTAHGDHLLQANDTWFAPSDVTTGPDGAVYVSDWCDKRTAHPDPDADWDRSNGRIYRIRPAEILARRHSEAPRKTVTPTLSREEKEKRATSPFPPGERPGLRELIDRLFSPAAWHSRRALRQLAEQRDKHAIPPLLAKVRKANDPVTAVRALWGLNASGGFDEILAAELLDHPEPAIRAWTIRFLGDQRQVSAAIEGRLLHLATIETSPRVLAQLACSAKRLPALCGLRIADRIARNPVSFNDRCVPLLVWWAIEAYATVDRGFVLRTFASPQAWQAPLIRRDVLGRLIRRYTGGGRPEDFAAAAKLFTSAPDDAARHELLANLDEGLAMISTRHSESLPLGYIYSKLAVVEGGGAKPSAKWSMVPPELKPVLDRIESKRTDDPLELRVAVRLGSRRAYQRVLALVQQRDLPPAFRTELFKVLADLGEPDCVGVLLSEFRGAPDPAIRQEALSAAAHFDDPQVPREILKEYSALNDSLKRSARSVLLGRRAWVHMLLAAIDAGRFAAADIQPEELRPVALYGDGELDAAIRRRWGNIRAGTTEEKLADIRRLSNDLRAAEGRPEQGHDLFKKHCATCHTLFGEGTKLGPDLTTANRKDRDFLLVSIVDPSVQVRKEFLSYAVETRDGRVYTGVIVEQSPTSLTLAGTKNERTTIPRSQIEEMKEQPVSLMPERLLEPLKPQEVRDLFSYLQK